MTFTSERRYVPIAAPVGGDGLVAALSALGVAKQQVALVIGVGIQLAQTVQLVCQIAPVVVTVGDSAFRNGAARRSISSSVKHKALLYAFPLRASALAFSIELLHA